MSGVYFCSDLHLGHDMAARLRGYDSTVDHDIAIVDKLCNTIGRRDKLYILGDVAMDKGSLYMLASVNAQSKTMIYGNHDKYKLKEYLDIFDDLHGFFKYKNMWISHCPIHPQEMWRCEANIHGHLHKGAATPPLRYPYINMNWDWWGRPVELGEIKEMCKNKQDEQDLCN